MRGVTTLRSVLESTRNCAFMEQGEFELKLPIISRFRSCTSSAVSEQEQKKAKHVKLWYTKYKE
jgi:hypothetical protein